MTDDNLPSLADVFAVGERWHVKDHWNDATGVVREVQQGQPSQHRYSGAVCFGLPADGRWIAFKEYPARDIEAIAFAVP